MAKKRNTLIRKENVAVQGLTSVQVYCVVYRESLLSAT